MLCVLDRSFPRKNPYEVREVVSIFTSLVTATVNEEPISPYPRRASLLQYSMLNPLF
jgi:hypothetical protein